MERDGAFLRLPACLFVDVFASANKNKKELTL